MSDLPYFRHYASDHQARFLGLNRDENSAYHDIRDHIWIAGGALPDDDNLLARLTRCTLEEWLRIRGKLMAFFKISHGLWRHVELSQQKHNATKTHQDLSEAGRKGADKRWKDKKKLKNRAAISEANEEAISQANAQANGLSMAIQESDTDSDARFARIDSPPSLRSVEESTRPPPASPRSARAAKIKFWKRAEALVGDKGAIGRQLSQVGQQKVEEALNVLERAKPHEPVAFFVACCQGRTPEAPQPDHTYAGPAEPLSEETLQRIRLRIRNREEIPHAGTSQIG